MFIFCSMAYHSHLYFCSRYFLFFASWLFNDSVWRKILFANFWGSVKYLCFLEESYDSVCCFSYVFYLAKKFYIEDVRFEYIHSWIILSKDSYTVYVELFLDSLFPNLGRSTSLFPYSIHSIRRILIWLKSCDSRDCCGLKDYLKELLVYILSKCYFLFQ